MRGGVGSGGRKEGGREEEEEDQGPGGGDGKAAMRQQDTGATGVVGVVESRAIWFPVLVLSHRLCLLSPVRVDTVQKRSDSRRRWSTLQWWS